MKETVATAALSELHTEESLRACQKQIARFSPAMPQPWCRPDGRPARGKRKNASHSFIEFFSGCGEREPNEFSPKRAKSRPRDPSHSCFFQHEPAEFFRRQACASDIDPCVEGAIRQTGAEPRDLVQSLEEALPALGEYLHHMCTSTRRVVQRHDGSVLNKLGHGRETVDHK